MNDLTLSSSVLPIQIAKDVRCLIGELRAGFYSGLFLLRRNRLAPLARAIFFWRRTDELNFEETASLTNARKPMPPRRQRFSRCYVRCEKPTGFPDGNTG